MRPIPQDRRDSWAERWMPCNSRYLSRADKSLHDADGSQVMSPRLQRTWNSSRLPSQRCPKSSLTNHSRSHLGLRSRRAQDEPYLETKRHSMLGMAVTATHEMWDVSVILVTLSAAQAYSSSFPVSPVGPYRDLRISDRAFGLVL